MDSIRIFIITCFSLLIVSCTSENNNSQTSVTTQFADEPFAVISLGTAPTVSIEPEINPPELYFGPYTNGITAEQVAAAGEFTFVEFNDAYELTAANYPALSLNSDDFALEVIRLLTVATTNRVANKVYAVTDDNSSGVDTPISELWNRLTPGERVLAITSPYYGARTFLTVLAAKDLSATLFEGTTDSLEDGRGDAFRHSYWNWLMSECCSVTWAAAFGTAHEVREDQTIDSYKLRMDLNNNQVGRNVFSANPDASKEQAQQTLLSHDLEFVDHNHEVINYDYSRLVYTTPGQSMTIYDDGPEFDDVYGITANNENWGVTPFGGAKTITITRAPSGEHSLEIECLLDGTDYGCGFQFSFLGATVLSNGLKATSGQILLDELETYTETVTFPTIEFEKAL